MITPNPLFPGARIALVGASSAVPADRLPVALALVESLGLIPVPAPSCYYVNRHGYFAADDAQRARDIQEAFADDSISGVWCIRGGYGAHRLLPLLDLDAIARTPKWFGGYSDVTALHIAFNQFCGFVTFHTTMPSTEPDPDGYTMTYLRRALFGPVTGPLANPKDQPMTTLQGGSAAGALYCLSATAERDGMELIATVMKGPTSDKRFESAKSMLTFGFANYTLLDVYPDEALPPVEVALGEQAQIQPVLSQSGRILIDKAQVNDVTTEIQLTDRVEAPVEQGQKLGEMIVRVGGETQQVIPLVADQAVERLTFPGIFVKFIKGLCMAG